MNAKIRMDCFFMRGYFFSTKIEKGAVNAPIFNVFYV